MKLAGVTGWGKYSTITTLYKRDKNDDPDDGLEISSVQCHRRLFMLCQRDYKWELCIDIHAPLCPSGSITRRYETKADLMHDVVQIQHIWPNSTYLAK